MRRLALAPLVLALPSAASVTLGGCLVDRTALDGRDGGTNDPDVYVAPGTDADLDAPARPDATSDAWLDPTFDAWQPDAWAPDAWVPGPDAWTGGDAWAPDAFSPDAAAMCTEPHCEGDELVACDGTRTRCGLCETGPARCVELVPSNVPTGFVFNATALATDIAVSGTVTWNTGNCDSAHIAVDSGGAPMMLLSHPDQPGSAGEVCLFAANSFTFTAGANVQVIGTRPLVLLARDRIELATGAVLSAASPNTPGGNCALDRTGAGSGTGGNVGADGTGNDGGGGGGGFFGLGGDGGDGGGTGGGGGAGSAPSSMTLVPLVGGADGGSGHGGTGGFAGPGGGAIQLSAPRITLHGVVEAFGGGGGGGSAMNAGGGGGSGGGVHVEALVLDAAGGAIDVRGGAGGGGGCSGRGQCGGQNPAPDAMSGGPANGTCAGNGGAGAGDGSVSGDPGETASSNGGGGGGGAGAVVVRQYRSSAPVTTYPDGVLSSATVTTR
ncbi:MAG: hypothetical protein U0353_32760 [Sandaracinus sp.]